jgi:hypothetical protein
MDDIVEVELARIILQPKEQPQYIHLRVLDSDRTFPIVIGFYEAAEIHRKLSGDTTERPLTHDLIGRVLETTEWELQRVVINALRDSTFFAFLQLAQGDDEKIVDCRPSDAIALAVQRRAPIFVAREVLDVIAPD